MVDHGQDIGEGDDVVGTSGTKVRKVGLVAAVALALAGTGAAPSGSTPTAGTRPARAAGTIVPRLLVPLRAFAPVDVAVSAEGTVYAAEPSTGRVLVQSPDHPPHTLELDGLEAPSAVAVAADGTVYVADGARVVSVDPDGAQADVALTGVGTVTDLDVDPEDGSLLVADPSTPQVLRLATDGTQTAVDLDGHTTFAGVAAGTGGDVHVIDLDANDVAVLHPDGTSDLTGLDADLLDPAALDVLGTTVAVAQPGGIVRSDGGLGSVTSLAIATPGGIALTTEGPDGEGFATTAPDGQCRCPEAPGSVLNFGLGGGTVPEVRFGDVATIPAVAATALGTVVFASSQGPLGYSDPNPIRQVDADGTTTDLGSAGDASYALAAAPDGTRYTSAGATLTRTAPDGTTSAVDLPTEAGMDQVVGLAVDEAGRLFVALGSGYGSGTFLVVEPLATGGPATWYRSEGSEYFHALGAGGGTVQLVSTPDGGTDLRLLELTPGGGAAKVRATLDDTPVDSLTVDQAGVAHLVHIASPHAELLAIPASGTPSTIAYAGERSPSRVSMGTDGTLYVVDAEVGLLALDGVGAAAPAVPPPAVPVPGAADYTG